MTGLLERSTAPPAEPGPAPGPGRPAAGPEPVVAAEVIPSVFLRAAVAADADEVRAFLRGLTLDSAYRRFFTGLGSVPDSLVRRLIDTRDGRTVVLATAGPAVVGVADTTVVDGGTAVELGVVVADHWQRHGLGWLLADAALAPAIAAKIPTFRAHTLADNARVARMLRRRWPAASPRFDDGTLIWELDLTGPGTAGTPTAEAVGVPRSCDERVPA